MQYIVIFEKDVNSYGAYVPNLPGCVAIGETMDEVRGLITDVIQFHIEGLQKMVLLFHCQRQQQRLLMWLLPNNWWFVNNCPRETR